MEVTGLFLRHVLTLTPLYWKLYFYGNGLEKLVVKTNSHEAEKKLWLPSLLQLPTYACSKVPFLAKVRQSDKP